MAALLPVLVCVLFTLYGTSWAQSCPVVYRVTGKDVHSLSLTDASRAESLLFNGVLTGCLAGCQPRGDVWDAVCTANPDKLTVINACEEWQKPIIQNVAYQVSQGAALQLSPCDLYEFLGARTLWIIGDSHTKNLFSALRCFMIDFWDHNQGECQASSNNTLQTALEVASLKNNQYNTPPRCLHLTGGSRICLVHNPLGTTLLSNPSEVSGTLQLLYSSFVTQDDIVQISFGRWHANNCDGVDDSYETALDTVGSYLQANRATFPNVLFQVAAQDHSYCVNETFNDSLPYCMSAAQAGYSVEVGDLLSTKAAKIMSEKFGIPVVDSFRASLVLSDGHVMPRQTMFGKIDCLHYCRPGMPEIDIWYMYKAFQTYKVPKKAPAYGKIHECVTIKPQLFEPWGAKAPAAPAAASPADTTGTAAPTSAPASGATSGSSSESSNDDSSGIGRSAPAPVAASKGAPTVGDANAVDDCYAATAQEPETPQTPAANSASGGASAIATPVLATSVSNDAVDVDYGLAAVLSGPMHQAAMLDVTNWVDAGSQTAGEISAKPFTAAASSAGLSSGITINVDSSGHHQQGQHKLAWQGGTLLDTVGSLSLTDGFNRAGLVVAVPNSDDIEEPQRSRRLLGA